MSNRSNTTQEPESEHLARFINQSAREIQPLANILGWVGLFVIGAPIVYLISLFLLAHWKLFGVMVLLAFGMCAVAIWEDYHK